MTAFEQQVLKALNEIAGQAGSLRAQMTTSCLERWGPLLGVAVSVLVALVGWWFIGMENRRSNRDALRLQLADAARNRILDALYDYEDFLIDAKWPYRLFRQDRILSPMPFMSEGDESWPLDTILSKRQEIPQVLRDFILVDRRRHECFRTMHRDAWALMPEVSLSADINALERRNEVIVSSLVDYYEKAMDALLGSVKSAVSFIWTDRDEVPVNQIDEQIAGVLAITALLQRPLESVTSGRRVHFPSRGKTSDRKAGASDEGEPKDD